ncbi:MAG: glycoside hydrolase family 25 protein [Bacilli bacterium]
MLKGIDVSSYQRNIDWEETKDYIDFAIIRCGFGNNITSQDDNKWYRNTEECTRLNIPFGTYLYSYALNLNMAQSEVEHTLRLIKDKKLEYPVFIDVEDREQLKLPKEELISIIKYYCEQIEKAGYYVGIYASLYTFENYLNSEELDHYDKWIAQWNKDLTYHGEAGMWQFTDNEIIPGINTRVDGDKAFYNYPKIIRDNGLNHLEEIKPNLKYKVGDRLYLNGPLYKNNDANEIERNYCNKRVRIIKIYDNKNAPYELNIGGYAKEENLSKTK